MRLPLLTIPDVADAQLCSGCGICAGLSPDRYGITDIPGLGKRPLPREKSTPQPDQTEAELLAACPGRGLEHTFDEADPDLDRSLRASWGPVYEVWEGHAADPDIRKAGSSGGAATALALWALERGHMHGVLHTAADPDTPYRNTTILSRSRDDLLNASGSRYAPASPAEGLPMVLDAPAPCVFIGKPCDAAAVQQARRKHTALDEKLGLVIAFFCAGTPSTQATLDLMQREGVTDPAAVTSLRYRGNGWPGEWVVAWNDNGTPRKASLSYADSWDFLQRSRQWRCYICPDHTGEFADIAVGDPWYRPTAEAQPGSSLLIARTRRGVEMLRQARDDGYLTLTACDHSLLPRSQPNLLKTRGRLWGQLLALRLARAPAPRFAGFPTFHRFLRLSPRAQAQSLLGTLRRYKRHLKKADALPAPPAQEETP